MWLWHCAGRHPGGYRFRKKAARFRRRDPTVSSRLTAHRMGADERRHSDHAHRGQHGGIKAVIVGADRIAANGDVANKIGTYSVAVLAKEHAIPFYVAAPWSTVDMNMPNGDGIPIEQRSPREVTHHAGKQVAPDGVLVENPAFDVTPNKYVTAIVTERGIARAPYGDALKELAGTEAVKV